MPRRRSRYARLLRELKTTAGSPTPGSELDLFNKFLTGERKITVKNKVPAGGKDRYGVTVMPFAVTPTGDTADQRYTVSITAYSYLGLTTRSGLAIADFGIGFSETGNVANPFFYPALIKPSYSSSATAESNKESAVTGKRYEYTPTRTFSIPFGRTTTTTKDAKSGTTETTITNVDELDVLKSLRAKMNEKTGDEKPISISYEPELLKPQELAVAATQASDIKTEGISVAG